MSRLPSPWSPHLPIDMAARPYDTWLRERRSLTARWQRASGAFRVEPVRQAICAPFADEYAMLRLPPRQLAQVRDVVLYCRDVPVGFAHTVVPLLPRGPVRHWLRRLGRRPLGTLLFSHPGFVRLGVEYAAIDARHPLHRGIYQVAGDARLERVYWARRALFAFGEQRILLTEVFLPAVLAY
jgi:chorismate--pyruvate lyase